MNDIQTVLRYSLPGILSLIELSIFALISSIKPLKDLQTICGGTNSIQVSVVVLVLTFFSIGLGFLYSIIHRAIPFPMTKHQDFLKAISSLKIINLPEICIPGGQTRPPNLESTHEAWITFNTIWYMRSETSDIIKGATPRSQTLANLAHSAGSSLIALIVSIIFYFVLYLYVFDYNFCQCRTIIVITTMLALSFMHGYFFFTIRRDQKMFVEMALLADLKQSASLTNKIKSFLKI